MRWKGASLSCWLRPALADRRNGAGCFKFLCTILAAASKNWQAVLDDKKRTRGLIQPQVKNGFKP